MSVRCYITIMDIRKSDKIIIEESKKYPDHLVRVEGDWYHEGYDLTGFKEVWYSKRYRVMVFLHSDGIERLSVLKLEIDPKTGEFSDDIKWREFQDIKRQCGRGNKRYVEVFPPDDEIMDFGCHRHLWLDVHERDIWSKKKKNLSAKDEIFPSDILKYSFQ